MRGIVRFLIAGMLTGLVVGHDMWLETDTFIVAEAGRRITLRNGNGTIYRKSENAVATDRIAKLLAVGPSGSAVELAAPAVNEPWLEMSLLAEREGNYWVALSTMARNIRLSGSDFTEYLEHDGIPNVLKERESKGISDRDEIERYSKYVKAFLQVGGEHSSNYDEPLDLEIEIIPLENPYSIGVGRALPIQVLFRGEPLAGLTLHAGHQGQSEESVHLETDQDGKAAVPISAPGRWYVRGIHLIQVDKPEHSYESYWATLTFQVSG